MRVLLINTNRKKDLLAAPPLGLCYVATAAEAAGHDVRLLDLCFAGSTASRKLQEAVRSFKPGVIGLSLRNIDNVNMLHPVSYLPDVLRLLETIKLISEAIIVIGGSGASLMPEHIFKKMAPDYLVVSDGERPFVQLLECLQEGQSPESVPGLGMMLAGKFQMNQPQLGDFGNLDPDLGKWVSVKGYRRIGGSYNVQTKRGCGQSCIYCTYNQSIEGNRIRLRSPLSVVEEIENALMQYRPKCFEFVDSVFNDPIEHSVEIMEEICRRPWKTQFTAMGLHPRGLDDKYLNLMWRSGFRSFMITPESASSKMLRNYRKGFCCDDVVKAAEFVNKTSFAAWWFFMVGGPGETNQSLQESIDFAVKRLQKSDRRATNVAHFFIGVRAYPGTTLWDMATESGFVEPESDPLAPTWYLSEELDLDRAVHQMVGAAAICPEIYLGFDERILEFSRLSSIFFDVFKFPTPYWQYFPLVNRIGIKTGLRFMYRPNDMPGMLRNSLKQQGYKGRLLRRISPDP